MWRRSKRCLVRCLWSNSFQKLLTTIAVFILITLLLWYFASEVLAFKFSSIVWRWPRPWPDKREEVEPVNSEVPPTPSVRRYHHYSGTHHYVVGKYQSLGMGRKRHRKKDVQVNHLLRILVLSDPHIMCTFNK